jgi:hypothetical protein
MILKTTKSDRSLIGDAIWERFDYLADEEQSETLDRDKPETMSAELREVYDLFALFPEGKRKAELTDRQAELLREVLTEFAEYLDENREAWEAVGEIVGRLTPPGQPFRWGSYFRILTRTESNGAK